MRELHSMARNIIATENCNSLLNGSLKMSARCLQMDAEREAIAQRPKTAPGVAMKSTNMCYIIFTSGSTGRPKGTVLQHAGVVNYFLSLVE